MVQKISFDMVFCSNWEAKTALNENKLYQIAHETFGIFLSPFTPFVLVFMWFFSGNKKRGNQEQIVEHLGKYR